MIREIDRIRQVAAAQLDRDPAAGAALCVLHDGVEIINETWGLADAEARTPYSRDTLQIVQSMGKGVIGAAAAVLIGRGQLDPAERVATYWPEFGTAGKETITVAQLLSHQCGLLFLDGTMPLDLTTDRERLTAALVAQAPAWEPGTAMGYSPQLVGQYADLLFERASGQGFAELLAEITEHLQIEMHVGLPPAQRHRAARVMAARGGEVMDLPEGTAESMADPDSLLMKMLRNIPGTLEDAIGLVNGDAVMDAFMPAANMFTSASAFAHLYDALSRTVRGERSSLWSPAVLEQVTTEIVRGVDAVIPMPGAFALAFQKPSTTYPFARSRRAFGHGGAGGSFAMADPDAGLAMCWLPTRYSTDPFDGRQTAVLDAAYRAVA